MDIDEIYEELAKGTTEPVDLSWTRRKLQFLALERAKTGKPEQRLGALRVASVLGRKDGLPIVQQLVRDPDPAVRDLAFRHAVEAHELGISAIRDAADGPDPEIVAKALDHLILWVDQAGMATARRALQHEDARVRERAVRLLGHIGGPAVKMELSRLSGDPSPDVKAAVSEALERLSGAIPRGTRTSWWTEDGKTVAPAAPLPGPQGEAPAPGGAVETRAEPLWAPDPTSLVPVATASESPAAPWRRVEVPEPEPAPAPWDGQASPLPAALPTETRALVRLLGMVASADRDAVLAVLRADPAPGAPDRAAEWSDLLHAHLSSGVSQGVERDVALTRGLLLAVPVHGRGTHVTPIRGLLRDADPRVRAAAASALGAIGPASLVPALAQLLTDPDQDVKLATVEAIATLGRRTGRADLARDALTRGRGDVSLRDAIDRSLAQ